MRCVPGRWSDRGLAPSPIIAQTFSRGSLRTYLRKMKRKMQNALQRLWCSRLTCEGRGDVWSLHRWWRRRTNERANQRRASGPCWQLVDSRRLSYVGATTELHENIHAWKSWPNKFDFRWRKVSDLLGFCRLEEILFEFSSNRCPKQTSSLWLMGDNRGWHHRQAKAAELNEAICCVDAFVSEIRKFLCFMTWFHQKKKSAYVLFLNSLNTLFPRCSI